MISWYREIKSGHHGRGDLARRRRERFEREVKERQEAAEKEKNRVESRTKVAESRRWQFRFEDVRVRSGGKDEKAVGWRYGMPLEDRKKGQVKIPTKVEA